MIFPNNFIEILNDKNLMTNSTEAKVVTKKRSMAQEKSNNSLLTLKMINYQSETFDDNLVDWTVSEVNSRQITVQLNFTQPLMVSQGDKPDLILVLVNFSNFTDSYLQNLPEFQDVLELPRQMSSASEAKIVQ